MEGDVVLHIGAMKTGTSFVQSMLGLHPRQLAAAGAEYVGSFGEQMRAVQHAIKTPAQMHGWRQLIAAAPKDKTAIISMEFLSFAGPDKIDRMLEPLRGRDVRVVMTVRNQLHALPAQWQSHARNFGVAGWDEYQRQVAAKPRRRASNAYRTFHRAQDVVPILGRWVERPEVSRVDVVTVPPPDAPHDELWLRFTRACGITVEGVSLDAVKDNPSLGYASCDALRRLNWSLFGDAHPRLPGYRKLVRGIVNEALASLRVSETRPVVDHDAATYLVGRNREILELLAGGTVGHIGENSDLPVEVPPGAFPAASPPPPPEQVLRAAQAIWDHLARTTGASGALPEELDALTADSARMLRALAGKSAD